MQNTKEENEENFNLLLKINSAEDLLLTDEDTGEQVYAPINVNDVVIYKRETNHLFNEINHAISEIKYYSEKHIHIDYLFCIYQTLSIEMADYLNLVHTIHKKMYISIYKNYSEDILFIYREKLERVLGKFEYLVCQPIDTDPTYFYQFPNESDLRVLAGNNAKVITYDIIQPCPKEMVSSGLKLSLDNLLTYIDQIKHTISALSHLEDFRSEHEKAIIYHYIKKQYDDNTLPKHLEKEVRKIQLYFEDRRMETNKANLSFQMNKIVEKYYPCSLCKVWYDIRYIEDSPNEILACMLCQKQALPDDFNKLFMFQGEFENLRNAIAKADDYEHHGDSFFVNWVDPAKLEEILKFWIKGNIVSQQKWYIVWCLMKYTFHIIRDDQDKNDFANRMNLMFPDAEKKCISNSFRRMENIMNHNKDFAEWHKDTDPDYKIAREFYDKLKKMTEYKRTFYFA
nr:hypothetical protein [Prevotella sp.]